MVKQTLVLMSLSFILFPDASFGFQSTPINLPSQSRVSHSSYTSCLFAKASKVKTRSGEFWEARMDGWRPTVNDVERISWGKPAKKKGTGSRNVPHRLNEEERFLFEHARRKGYLEIAGSGWRSQRREAPLLNSYRSLCDARGQASIVLHKGSTGMDELVVDISPLRNPQAFDEIAAICLEERPGGEVVNQANEASSLDELVDDEDEQEDSGDATDEIEDDRTSTLGESTPWETRPIYQLPPYCIGWEVERSEAKTLGKLFAEKFDTIEKDKKTAKKPIGVKPGKGRRHGGYGIG